MDQEQIATFVYTSAEEVFATMLGIQISRNPVYGEANTVPASERVVSLIGLAGPFMGTGMITCSPKFACRISSVMLMAEYSAVDGDVLDAIGEISNMIFGNVKTFLEEEFGALGLSVPTVIFGRNFSTRSIGQQWIVVPVAAGSDELELKISLTRNSDSAACLRAGHLRPYSLQD